MKKQATHKGQRVTPAKDNKFSPPPLLLFGGEGAEHNVSTESAESLYGELLAVGIKPRSVYIDSMGGWFIGKHLNSPKALSSPHAKRRAVYPARRYGKGGLLSGKRFIPASAAIPVLHGNLGEDGTVAGALKILGIPFVGCGVTPSAICADKSLTKRIADTLGIPTVPSVTIKREDIGTAKERVLGALLFTTEEKTGEFCLQNSAGAVSISKDKQKMRLLFPVFIKPTDLGSSLGASVARNECELADALERAFSLSDCVLVERFIEGVRELECAYFEHKSKQYFTNIGEIHHGGSFYGYDEKYSSAQTKVALADIDTELSERIREYSRALVDTLGISQLSRIDFFLSSDGELYFNEINTMPGLTAASMLPFLIRDSGLSVGEVFGDFLFAL